MNETTLFAVIFMTLLLLLVQRSEKRARRVALVFAVCVFLLMRHASIAQEDEGMAWRALLIAVVINSAFWFLIGRYNPPRTNNEITVIGMDD